jgi:hypothetical protein
MMMGRSTLDAICLTICSENAADCVEVPISMVGSEFATTSARGDAGALGTGPLGDLAGWASVRNLEVVQRRDAVVGDQALAVQRVEPSGRLLAGCPLAHQ